MFPYFGSKGRVAHLYPPPAQGRVVEPFGGSARYSLLYWEREVWINDIDPTIYRIWKYLQKATAKDIDSLPELRAGENLRDFKTLADVERELLGFAMSYGTPTPSFVCSPVCGKKEYCRLLKQRIFKHLPHIKHWKVTCQHYSDLPNETATWFVDPPYQYARTRYRYDCITDYRRLARWCRSRRGRVIVCEARAATWLPFQPFAEQWTSGSSWIEEVVWARDRE